MQPEVRLLVLGATGLLGTSLCDQARRLGFNLVTLARSAADIEIDIGKPSLLKETLQSVAPDLVINAVANVNLAACEADPDAAYAINAAPVAILANWSVAKNRPFVQISSDHFFDGSGSNKHNEDAAITICNQYARSKLAGEEYAKKAPKAMIVRTSIAGFHPDERGFAQWAIRALLDTKPLTLYDDFFGSTIDTQSFAVSLFDLIEQNFCGIINLASSEVSSKKQFVHGLANALGIDLDWAQTGSVAKQVPRRARCLGLDVERAENLLGYSLPGRNEVCANLVQQWKQKS